LNTPTDPPPPPPASNQGSSKSANPNPNLVHTPRSERKLLETKGQYPIASRRRRAALANSSQVPFTQLPYQCFQEARKILAADRAEKVEEIERIRARIDALQTAGDGVREGETGEQGRVKRENIIRGLKQRLEKYKIYADINDPIVKKKFEDGQGTTSWTPGSLGALILTCSPQAI
jgi:large subunit ribosomal protein L35